MIGAGSGMGAAVAKSLAPRGRLVLADRDHESVKRLARDIGGAVDALECDITNQAQIDALVNTIENLDALVITAGLSGSMANGRRIFEVNLIGTARVLSAVEPMLRPGTVGVCFASISGHRVPDRAEMLRILADPLAEDFFDAFEAIGIDPDQTQFAYPASKRGVHLLVRRLCQAWGEKGARILSVSPGINDTPMNRLDESRHAIMADIIATSPSRPSRHSRRSCKCGRIPHVQ